ncbi:MAG: hypothetical protein HYV40_00240 [Candidatus Levybacteria bacterium]|nr:hypothetical protein [Candidatus Levybacteria bacterium]
MKFLKTLWKYWMKIANRLGNFQAKIFFSVFYFLILFVMGIPFRLFSDPLRVYGTSLKKKTNFSPWEHQMETLEEARKPF